MSSKLHDTFKRNIVHDEYNISLEGVEHLRARDLSMITAWLLGCFWTNRYDLQICYSCYTQFFKLYYGKFMSSFVTDNVHYIIYWFCSYVFKAKFFKRWEWCSIFHFNRSFVISLYSWLVPWFSFCLHLNSCLHECLNENSITSM